MDDRVGNLTDAALEAASTVAAAIAGSDGDVTGDSKPYSITQTVLIGTITAILSIMTVVGNIMVMISFKIDKQLQTISNYFLFSLAIADFAIGLISMPLFTVQMLMGYWPLGPHICDTWLALDYLASNASVLNLLIISFDRYFSVTRPLTYRVRRTTSKAAVMIGCAWGISLLLWPPWIYSWPYIEGERTVPDNECYIQFIATNYYITFGTAIAAFYVPVTVMCFLYWRIWRTTKKRQKDLPNLQAGKKDSSKRSNSSDETNNAACATVMSNIDADDNTSWHHHQPLQHQRRPRSESAADGDSIYSAAAISTVNSTINNNNNNNNSLNRRSRNSAGNRPVGLWGASTVKAWCVAWWHSGREDSDTEEDTPSEQNLGYATPVSVETPLQSSVSRCTSLNVIRDSVVSGVQQQNTTPTRSLSAARDTRSLPPVVGRLGNRSVSSDSVYTILIRLPAEPPPLDQPSIKMLPATADGVASRQHHDELVPNHHHLQQSQLAARRPSAMPDIRIPLNAKIIPKQLGGVNAGKQQAFRQQQQQNRDQNVKKKKKPQEKKADKKAAKTLSAILLTFIVTWTPYNILVLLKPVTGSSERIPQGIWDFFYYLCYINSTINPMCYALCNASFRRTYLRILQCKWHNRNRAAMNRGYYN